MNQELIFQASLMKKQAEELETHSELLQNQIEEMEKIKESITHILKTNEKEMLSSLGKGVHLKSELKEKALYVEVGSGVIVKKTPDETLDVINSQLRKLNEARLQISGQLDIYKDTLKKIIKEIQGPKK